MSKTKKKRGQSVQRKRDKRKVRSVSLKFGTLNVGTITGESRELADITERRKLDILFVQETRSKGSKVRNTGGGYKLFSMKREME